MGVAVSVTPRVFASNSAVFVWLSLHGVRWALGTARRRSFREFGRLAKPIPFRAILGVCCGRSEHERT
jgi:hypothetical protein